MDTSVETLLTTIVIILSALAIIALTGLIITLVAIRRVIRKAQMAADASHKSITLFNHLLERRGLFAIFAMIFRLLRR